MNNKQIKSQVAAMGARFQARLIPVSCWSVRDYTVDIKRKQQKGGGAALCGITASPTALRGSPPQAGQCLERRETCTVNCSL
jgi:hypothetical protein